MPAEISLSTGIVKRPSDDLALCGECHADVLKKQTSPTAHAPFRGGSCGSCHDPHGSKNPRFVKSDVKLLCLHHCVEGATCGPGDFTFRDGSDVIPRAALPADVAAVLCGHIHRHQVLRAPGLPPVIYSGSTERTSFAEAGETKGVVLLWLSTGWCPVPPSTP